MDISKKAEQTAHNKLWLMVAVSFVVQMLLAGVTESYPYDAGCFEAWSMRVASMGPGAFYSPDYFCDYPPGYILMLWLPGQLLHLVPPGAEALRRMVIALWPSLATALCGPVIYHFARKRINTDWALRCAAAAMFCPALLFNSGVWGQIDGVFTLMMLCCFVMLEEKCWLTGALYFGLALVIKPQALLAGPALAICFLLPILCGKDAKERLQGVKNGALGALVALAPAVGCGVLFWGVSGVVQGLAEKYFTTTTSSPYATINAANLMAVLGGEWVPQDQMVRWFNIPLMSWQTLGTILLVLVTIWTFVWAYQAYRHGKFSPVLTAAVYVVAVFTVSHRMHERYLIFAAILLAAAAACFGSRKLLGLSGGISLVSLFNMALVYCTVGGEDEFLSNTLNSLMLRSIGLAEVILCLMLMRLAWNLCAPEAPVAANSRQIRSDAAHKAVRQPLGEAPRWTKKEALSLVALTVVTAVVSFVYLGDLTAPQTCVDANGDNAFQYVIEVPEQAQSVWVYAGISNHNNGEFTLTDSFGVEQVKTELNHSSTFKWNRFVLDNASGPYTATVKNGQIFELSFRDAEGQPIAVTAEEGCALVDEQTLVPKKISQLNSFYFDEIYHARTGYEHLHKMNVYETTHPPMGKNFIAMGIALFGMTGFGWRFFGTLFGVLMVPALYDFVRRLTRKPHFAGFAAALLALDFMRFSQSRLATIDSYVVLFILLGADMMLWYCQSVLKKGVGGSLLPMALGGIAFGFGCASKWTGIYAGAGLAILYFGVLWQRGRALLEQPNGKEKLKQEVTLAIAGGVLFYVVLPLAIYLLSYLPYVLRDPGFGLKEWWGAQESMLWYHSQLEATHPFASEWYTWLLDARPVWYYVGSDLPDNMAASIAGFVSPVLMAVGMVAWMRLAYRQLVGKGSPEGGFVIVVTLSSLLPWVLVSRCTFLYHFFPCVPMLVAAAAMMLSQWEDEGEPQKARRWGIGILIAALVLFIWFYPVLSGLPIPKWWAASMKWMPSWGFYSL